MCICIHSSAKQSHVCGWSVHCVTCTTITTMCSPCIQFGVTFKLFSLCMFVSCAETDWKPAGKLYSGFNRQKIVFMLWLDCLKHWSLFLKLFCSCWMFGVQKTYLIVLTLESRVNCILNKVKKSGNWLRVVYYGVPTDRFPQQVCLQIKIMFTCALTVSLVAYQL